MSPSFLSHVQNAMLEERNEMRMMPDVRRLITLDA
jgi:hypothetical protein